MFTAEEKIQLNKLANLMIDGSKLHPQAQNDLFTWEGESTVDNPSKIKVITTCALGAVLAAVGELKLQADSIPTITERGYSWLKNHFPVLNHPWKAGSIMTYIWGWNQEKTREEVAQILKKLAEK